MILWLNGVCGRRRDVGEGLPTFFCLWTPPRINVKHKLEAVVAQELTALEFELAEFRVGGSKSRPVLDIRIDRLDAQKVQVGDCERASRAIEARLDAMPDVIDGRYVLEVSSPGMERPLRTVAHWRRFAGRKAIVTSTVLAAIGGRAEVEIVGVDGDADSDARITVKDAKGNTYAMTLAEISEARLAFHWKP
jgi:ribosome maturation factor RimP